MPFTLLRASPASMTGSSSCHCISVVTVKYFFFTYSTSSQGVQGSSSSLCERHQTSRILRSFRYKAVSLCKSVLFQLKVDSLHIDRFNSSTQLDSPCGPGLWPEASSVGGGGGGGARRTF